MTNPLLQLEGLPSFPEIQAEHMLPAIESVVADARLGIEKILISDFHTYDSLVHVREELESRINEFWSPISHMNSVVNSEEIRTAHQASLEILTAYHTEIGQNKALYHAYQSVRASQQFEMLSIEQQKVIDNALRRLAIGLPSPVSLNVSSSGGDPLPTGLSASIATWVPVERR